MIKRILALIVVMFLMFSLTACISKESPATGKSDSTSKGGAKAQEPESQKIAKLVVAFPTFTGPPPDLLMIQNAMNDISRKKIGVEVELLVTDIASYNQQMKLMLTGREPLDIISTVTSLYVPSIQNGQLLDLEENNLLETYGQGIIDAIGWDYINACRVGGVLYGLPNNRDFAQGRGCAAVRTDLLKGIGYEFKHEGEIEHITLEQLNDIYTKIHEKYPELEIYRPASTSMLQFSNVDALGGNVFGVLLDYGATLDVVNLFESDFYMEYAKRIRDYYLKGYISQDAATDTTAVTELVKSGTLASYTTGGKPGIKQQETNLCGMEMTIFQTLGDHISSTSISQFPWSIPINCTNTEAAMKYLNLIYTDADMMNLISWGVEGEHYIIQDDGLANFPEGVNATNSGYIHSMGWLFFNQFITHVWAGNDPNLWDNIRKFNNEAYKSAALGFTFDPANVSNELTAVQNVYDEYQKSIEYGLVDPVSGIAEMNEKMKAAGLDKIIVEKQAQLNAWVKTKK
jgi:putative aldouronate transport system substrate-binding protein